jgi:pyruvate formate lyase activating enzyme
VQQRFLLKLFAAAQKLGVHTALDTNGYLGDRLSDEDLGCIDLVMLGLKAITPELHQRLTGMDPGPVHAFARRLADRRRPVWIRFVVVPGWTDNLDEVGRMADFAAGLGNVERVDVLPFHQLGSFKWEKLGMEYQLKDAKPPSREKVEKVITRFRAAGLNVV